METLRSQLGNLLVDPLRARLGGRLEAVVVHGSAVAFLDDEDAPLLANVNVLLVVDQLDLGLTDTLRGVLLGRDLEALEVVLLARGELARLAEVFPAESRELKECHEVLHGADPLVDLEVPDRNLAHQIAYELHSRRQALLHLLVTRGPTDASVGRQLLGMAGGFGVLGRQLLRLRGVEVSRSLEELLAALEVHGGLDARAAEAVRELQATREDRRRPARAEKREILEAFLEAWDRLVDLSLGPLPAGPEQGRLPF